MSAIGVHCRRYKIVREASQGVGAVGLPGNPIDFHNRSVPAIGEQVGDDQAALEVRNDAGISPSTASIKRRARRHGKAPRGDALCRDRLHCADVLEREDIR